MRKACIQTASCYASLPGFVSDRLFHFKRCPVLRTVPVMKFMHRNAFPFFKQHGIFFCCHDRVSKALQTVRPKSASIQNACHLPDLSFSVFQFLLQIQEAAAFRNRRHSMTDRLKNCMTHPTVFRKLPGVQPVSYTHLLCAHCNPVVPGLQVMIIGAVPHRESCFFHSFSKRRIVTAKQQVIGFSLPDCKSCLLYTSYTSS